MSSSGRGRRAPVSARPAGRAGGGRGGSRSPRGGRSSSTPRFRRRHSPCFPTAARGRPSAGGRARSASPAPPFPRPPRRACRGASPPWRGGGADPPLAGPRGEGGVGVFPRVGGGGGGGPPLVAQPPPAAPRSVVEPCHPQHRPERGNRREQGDAERTAGAREGELEQTSA